jgi:hypothetical protein
MTQKQAESQLEKLRKQHCTCDCEPGDVELCQHCAGCPYRFQVRLYPELRPFAGEAFPARAA